MTGIKYFKAPPTVYVIKYRKGEPVRKGTGLSFFYYAPTTTLVAVPIGSSEAPFMIEQVTEDFQQVTVQGSVTYRVTDPERLAGLLDFTLGPVGGGYASEDPKKLPQRIINLVKVIIQREVKARDLRGALGLQEGLAEIVEPQMLENREMRSLGIEVLGVAVMAIKPGPETARALEARAREQILKEADDALYDRRNASVEQERKVKENELNTEIAVENKQRQIQDARMNAQRALQEREQEMETARQEFEIQQEEKRKTLVDLAAINARKEADAKAYGLQVMMGAFATADNKTIQALASIGMRPEQMIASAFQGLAENASKIGELSITPDLLNNLIKRA